MTDPAAEALAMICDDWLRRVAADGGVRLGPVLRAGLAQAALGAPQVAACCPLLLRAVGPPVAQQVKAQASAPHASDVAQAAADRARWMTTRQAAAALTVTPNNVRDLLRRRQLDGDRTERGWRVDARSVAAYGQRRRDGRTAA